MKQEQNDIKPDTIPVYVYDDMAVRNAHRERIHWIVHIIELVMILLIVGGFLLYLNQYEYVSNETVTVDGESGTANYIGKDGNIYNGEDSSSENPSTGEEIGQAQESPAP